MQLKADVVQTSTGGDLMGDTVTRYVEIDKEIETALLRCADARHEIEATIRSIRDTRLSDVLWYRYVKLIPLMDVCDYMRKPNGKRYSYQHIRRLHAEAVKEVDKIIKNT